MKGAEKASVSFIIVQQSDSKRRKGDRRLGSPNLRPRYNKNWFAVLFLCLLSTLHSVFVVIMDIDIVIPKTGDQSDPDIQMLCFRIEVELCRSIGRLRISAEPLHGVQSPKSRQLKQSVLEFVDFRYQFRRRLLSTLIVPSRPPFVSVIIRARIG